MKTTTEIAETVTELSATQALEATPLQREAATPLAGLRAKDRAILLRYHEVALKGGNRAWFEMKLAQNARRLVSRALGQQTGYNKNEPSAVQVRRDGGRILLYADWNDASRGALSHVFGLSGFGPIRIVETSLESVLSGAVEAVLALSPDLPRSFRVRTRRSDKALRETSPELDRLAGAAIQTAFPQIRVDLKNAEVTVGIEIHRDRSYVWADKYKGCGGLPVGTAGLVLTLISGGIDSPVAAIRALKRGATSEFVHFHGAPFVGPEALEKVEGLVRIVNRYQPDPRPLHVIPFGNIQEKIAHATNAKVRTVLYRRMMVRIATKLAYRLRAEALVSGESLGQVASQTLCNLTAINAAAADIPVLRPLIAFDKLEIVNEAKLRGTHDLSIQPADDCCTLFADRRPSIAVTDQIARAEEALFDLEALEAEALAGVQVLK